MIIVFKLKTAYDVLISDGSSDVCSSDLSGWRPWLAGKGRDQRGLRFGHVRAAERPDIQAGAVFGRLPHHMVARYPQWRIQAVREIGRASCRERVCQYV